MYFDPLLLVVFILNFDIFLCKSSTSNSIKDQIQDYFNNVDTKSFMNAWSQYDLAVVSTITSELQYIYGQDSVIDDVKMILGPGFLVSDPNVDVLFQDMVLRDLPWITSQVDIALPSNYLSIQGIVLNSMYVDTNYILLRNHRGSHNVESSERRSPFSRKEVQNKGPLTIIVDGCQVNGTAIVALDGSSVSVTHTNVWLEQCSFSVEISTTGDEQPPIIAPYLSPAKREEMTRLLSRPIREALVQRLETILYANIDAKKIFQGNVDHYRNHQNNFFKVTGDFMTSIIAELNKLTTEKNQGRLILPASKEIINDKKKAGFKLKIYDAFLDGLENAYAPTAGGGYIINNKTIISDAINFNSLKVNGKISLKKNSHKTKTVIFSAELKDVAVNIELLLEHRELNVRLEKWRDLEFFLKDLSSVTEEKQAADTFLTGYLSQEVPAAIQRYVKEALPTILKEKTFLSNVNSSSENDYSTTSIEDKPLSSSSNNSSSSEKSIGGHLHKDDKLLPTYVYNSTETTTNKLSLKKRRSYGINQQNKHKVKLLKPLVQPKGKGNKKGLSKKKLLRKTKNPNKKLSLKTKRKSKRAITRKLIKLSRKPSS